MLTSSGQKHNVRYPYERINLPSNGQCYFNSLSCGKINLYPLTAKHEDILCSPGLYRDFKHFDIILEDIIENEDVDIDKLLIGDVEGILLAAKMLAFGPKQKVNITCPHCDQTDEYIINLSGYKPIEAVIPNEKTYTYKGYQIHFQSPTYKMFKQCDGSPPDILKSMIIEIFDGSDVRVDKDKFFKETFLYRDYQAFKRYITNCFPRITPELNISCVSCDVPIKLPFVFNRNFFGMDGNYKINLHKEIFSVVYSSNGGFGHSDVYDMPISLRLLYTTELKDMKHKEAEQMKNTTDAPSSTPIAGPPIPK